MMISTHSEACDVVFFSTIYTTIYFCFSATGIRVARSYAFFLLQEKKYFLRVDESVMEVSCTVHNAYPHVCSGNCTVHSAWCNVRSGSAQVRSG